MRRALIALAAVAAVTGCTLAAPTQPNNGVVCQAFDTQRSHVEVVASGTVRRVLGLRGGPNGEHEGFLMELAGEACGLSVKVETNVTFTGEIPLRPGEPVVVKGEYEFNRLGGVIHWTHRDPRGRHEGGFIRAGGRVYQ